MNDRMRRPDPQAEDRVAEPARTSPLEVPPPPLVSARRSPFLRPSRWPAFAGFGLVAIGTFLPWQTMTYPVGAPIVINGVAGAAAPGLQVLLFASGTAVLAGLRAVADTKTRTVQVMPGILGVVAFLDAVRAYWDVAPASVWDPSRTSRDVVEIGMWLTLLGGLAAAVGGVTTSIAVARDNPLRPEPWERPADLSAVEPLLSFVAGGTASLLIVGMLVPSLFGDLLGAATLPAIVLVGLALAAALHAAFGRIRPGSSSRMLRARSREGGTPDFVEPVRRTRSL